MAVGSEFDSELQICSSEVREVDAGELLLTLPFTQSVQAGNVDSRKYSGCFYLAQCKCTTKPISKQMESPLLC